MRIGISVSVSSPWQSAASAPAVVPSPPAVQSIEWSLADAATGGDLILTIISVPTFADAAEYSVDAGPWVPIPAVIGSTNLALGADATYTVALRWVQTVSSVDYFGTPDTKAATATTAAVATWPAVTVPFGAAA